MVRATYDEKGGAPTGAPLFCPASLACVKHSRGNRESPHGLRVVLLFRRGTGSRWPMRFPAGSCLATSNLQFASRGQWERLREVFLPASEIFDHPPSPIRKKTVNALPDGKFSGHLESVVFNAWSMDFPSGSVLAISNSERSCPRDERSKLALIGRRMSILDKSWSKSVLIGRVLASSAPLKAVLAMANPVWSKSALSGRVLTRGWTATRRFARNAQEC